MVKTYRYKLRPSPAQEQRMEQALETLRRLYRNAVIARRDLLRREGKHTTFFAQKVELKFLRACDPDLAALPYCLASGAYRRLDGAWADFKRRWARRSQAGETCPPEDAGMPRPPRFGEYNTLTYDSVTGSGWAYLPPRPDAGPNERGNAAVRASPFGIIRCVKDRPLPPGATILTRFEITRSPSGWYCAILVDDGVLPPAVDEDSTREESGCRYTLSLAQEPFAALSDGRQWTLPTAAILGASPRRIARLQRALQRKRDSGKMAAAEKVASLEKDDSLAEDERDHRIRAAKRAKSRRYLSCQRAKAREEERVRNRRKRHHLLIARSIVAGLAPGSVIEYRKPEILRAMRSPYPRPDPEAPRGSFLPNGAERVAARNKAVYGAAHAAFLTVLTTKALAAGILLREIAQPGKEGRPPVGGARKKGRAQRPEDVGGSAEVGL